MKEDELKNVYGGVSWGLLAGLCGLVTTFVLGLIEGITNPIKCGK